MTPNANLLPGKVAVLFLPELDDVAFSATNGTQPRVILLDEEFEMLDYAGLQPDLSLFVGPGDEVHFVCAFRDLEGGRDPIGLRGRSGLIYVVVHRSHGSWTHVYRVVPKARPGRLEVFVERVIEGCHARAACDWAAAQFGDQSPLTARVA